MPRWCIGPWSPTTTLSSNRRATTTLGSRRTNYRTWFGGAQKRSGAPVEGRFLPVSSMTLLAILAIISPLFGLYEHPSILRASDHSQTHSQHNEFIPRDLTTNMTRTRHPSESVLLRSTFLCHVLRSCSLCCVLLLCLAFLELLFPSNIVQLQDTPINGGPCEEKNISKRTVASRCSFDHL